MRAQRPPPKSPIRVAEELRAGVASGDLKFTANADLEVVVEQYRAGFIGAWNRKRGTGIFIYYRHLGWGNADGAILLEALEYTAEHCTFADRVRGSICVGAFNGNSMDELMSRRSEPFDKIRGNIKLIP